jgi:hypothetical protein
MAVDGREGARKKTGLTNRDRQQQQMSATAEDIQKAKEVYEALVEHIEEMDRAGCTPKYLSELDEHCAIARKQYEALVKDAA